MEKEKWRHLLVKGNSDGLIDQILHSTYFQASNRSIKTTSFYLLRQCMYMYNRGGIWGLLDGNPGNPVLSVKVR